MTEEECQTCEGMGRRETNDFCGYETWEDCFSCDGRGGEVAGVERIWLDSRSLLCSDGLYLCGRCALGDIEGQTYSVLSLAEPTTQTGPAKYTVASRLSLEQASELMGRRDGWMWDVAIVADEVNDVVEG